jgi:hypothetical protein
MCFDVTVDYLVISYIGVAVHAACMQCSECGDCRHIELRASPPNTMAIIATISYRLDADSHADFVMV